MKKVGAYQAKTHLSGLLKEVSKGARISITRNGVPVAMLVPAPSADKKAVLDTIRKIKEFRLGIALGGIPIREMIEEGRRR
jgi:prevent-host-death family protein